jgi:hypothetical protein
MTTDVLDQLADEHRELDDACAALCQQRVPTPAAFRDVVGRVVKHELAHRFLIHPLLDRDAHGEALRREARGDQRLVAAQLHQWFQSTPDEDEDSGQAMNEVVVVLDRHVAAHIDREEILTSPHARHTTTRTQRRRLAARYEVLRPALDDRLTATDALIWDGLWATAPRSELAALLDIEDDLVVVVPDLAPTRPDPSTWSVADGEETSDG